MAESISFLPSQKIRTQLTTGDEMNATSSAGWHGVPAQHIATWQAAFARPSPSIDVPGACPVCGHACLRRYYQRGKQLDSHAEFTHRGALWQWCSNCYAYEHAAALVPRWWNFEIDVDSEALTAIPSAIDEAWERSRPPCEAEPARSTAVSELISIDSGGNASLAARFVLLRNGTVTIVAPDAAATKAVGATAGRLPGPNGTWLTVADGRAFLELLPSNFRGIRLYASPVFEMDDRAALRSLVPTRMTDAAYRSPREP